MKEFNSYPVFVADQVLMADHLNDVMNYLDEQNRLTRNKLIGIGIVCGCELKVIPGSLAISKGCGVTSAGYLILTEALTLSHYRPYTLPADLYPKYRPLYESWESWQLLTAEQSLQYDDTAPINGNSNFLNDKIVVLMLEMKETSLKNCVDTDCDDKGDKIEFKVRPLLVRRSDIDVFIRTSQNESKDNLPFHLDRTLPDVRLRRFNVQVKDITSTDMLLNAFLEICNEATIKKVADAIRKSYQLYAPILTDDETDPFQNLAETLKEGLEKTVQNNPFFVQYYYDRLDDLIKAYDEFREKAYHVQTICCADDALFPLHLMLGEANRSTSETAKSAYRHYFIYAPVLSDQQDLLIEVRTLFKRLKDMVELFIIPGIQTTINAETRITPSRYLFSPLSERAIPFYYDPEAMFRNWSPQKNKKGGAQTNLSYHAKVYADSEYVTDPLSYDIEKYDFFRIEGIVGKRFEHALTNVIEERDRYNLPFEVVALSTATIARYLSAADLDCIFKDLNALYKVIIAEMVCRYGDLMCMIGERPFSVPGSNFNFSAFASEFASGPASRNININVNSAKAELLEISAQNLAKGLDLSAFQLPKYKRGDFFRNHCTVKQGTLGELFMNLVNQGYHFPKPAPSTNVNLGTVLMHLLYYMDRVEELMSRSWALELSELNMPHFKASFNLLTEAVNLIKSNISTFSEVGKPLQIEGILNRFRDFPLTCFDERLEALRQEYLRRYAEAQLLKTFMNYFRKHPGMEHKAGVPKGGTFIMVYHETPPRRQRFPLNVFNDFRDLKLHSSSLFNDQFTEKMYSTLMNEASVKDPVLLQNFRSALSVFLNTCKDMEETEKAEIKEILIDIPERLVPERFEMPERSVVADFYLPYLCCSDCAPITYVVQRQTEQKVTIDIDPKEFCNNERNAYTVSVSPEGGQLSSSGGGLDGHNFVPYGLEEGDYRLTYTMPNGQSAHVDIKVKAAFTLNFEYRVHNDGKTVTFDPLSASEFDLEWDFGDGHRSIEKQPTHTFDFSGESWEYVVTLNAQNGPCVASTQRLVSLFRPKEQVPTFNIEPRTFCSNDAREYFFEIEPFPARLTDIKRPSAFKLKRDPEANTLSFIPAELGLKVTKEFSLTYEEIPLDIKIVVANAGFTMQLLHIRDQVITRRPAEPILRLIAVEEQENTQYRWVIELGQGHLDFNTRQVDIPMETVIGNVRTNFNIILYVSHYDPNGDCVDKKAFLLTYDHLQKMEDGTIFDHEFNPL